MVYCIHPKRARLYIRIHLRNPVRNLNLAKNITPLRFPQFPRFSSRWCKTEPGNAARQQTQTEAKARNTHSTHVMLEEHVHANIVVIRRKGNDGPIFPMEERICVIGRSVSCHPLALAWLWLCFGVAVVARLLHASCLLVTAFWCSFLVLALNNAPRQFSLSRSCSLPSHCLLRTRQ